jgi:hypothetical protein
MSAQFFILRLYRCIALATIIVVLNITALSAYDAWASHQSEHRADRLSLMIRDAQPSAFTIIICALVWISATTAEKYLKSTESEAAAVRGSMTSGYVESAQLRVMQIGKWIAFAVVVGGGYACGHVMYQLRHHDGWHVPLERLRRTAEYFVSTYVQGKSTWDVVLYASLLGISFAVAERYLGLQCVRTSPAEDYSDDQIT